MGGALVYSAVAIVALMVITWIISLIVKDASIVDMVWGLGFVLATWAAALSVDGITPRGLLIAILVSIWGLRLSGYLVWRNLGKEEDRRYQRMREKNPDSFWIISLFKVFGLQAVLMWIIAVPPVLTQTSDSGLFWLDWVGVGIWLVGLFFETVGDFQLARFKSRPDSEGRVMDRGLWRYTRHPNYFGDFTVWWGHWVVSSAGGLWWTVFSPIVMSVLLMRVSGVALLEKDIEERRPEYQEYVEKTNAFFPGPPEDPTLNA